MHKLTILGGTMLAMLLFPGMSLAHSPTWHHGYASTWRHRWPAKGWFGSHRAVGPQTQGTVHVYPSRWHHGDLAWQNRGSDSAKAATAQGNGSASVTTSGSSGSQVIDGHTVVGTLPLTATAYAPTLQDNYPYGPVDYYGNPLVAGDVAVDPSVVPLGTLLWVTGYHSPDLPAGGFLARAVDTGGAIKGNRLDIFINASESEVSNFGIQQVKAYILGN